MKVTLIFRIGNVQYIKPYCPTCKTKQMKIADRSTAVYGAITFACPRCNQTFLIGLDTLSSNKNVQWN